MSRRVWRTESKEPEAPARTRLCQGLPGHTCAGVFPASRCEVKHTHRRARRTSLQTAVRSQSGHLCKRPSSTRTLQPAPCLSPEANTGATGTCISERQRLVFVYFCCCCYCSLLKKVGSPRAASCASDIALSSVFAGSPSVHVAAVHCAGFSGGRRLDMCTPVTSVLLWMEV